jgi:hypothetical protein
VRAAIALLLLCAACTPKTAEGVGDKFVDLYFCEIDQKRALDLTTGLARSKIEEELGLVAEIRKNISPDAVKPSIHYKRQKADVSEGHGRLAYDITISQGRDETKRTALVSVERVGDAWKVGNFIVTEGHQMMRPGAPAGDRP